MITCEESVYGTCGAGSGSAFGAALGALRFLRHSSKPCRTVKNDGTNSTARQVEAIMPLNTASPSEMRELAPAPVAVDQAALARDLDDQDRVLGAERDQEHQSDLGIEVVGKAQRAQRDGRPDQ